MLVSLVDIISKTESVSNFQDISMPLLKPTAVLLILSAHSLYRDNHYGHMQNYHFSRLILVYEIPKDVPQL